MVHNASSFALKDMHMFNCDLSIVLNILQSTMYEN